MKGALLQVIHLHLLDGEEKDWCIPNFNLCSNNSYLPYQDEKFDIFTNQNKLMIHLECYETEAPFVSKSTSTYF